MIVPRHIRFSQVLFLASLLGCSWLGMMAVHELGHVASAWVTGGCVQRVVLSPMTISRTDVSPNPHPAVVVWAGPLVGSLLPVAVLLLIRRRFAVLRNVAIFFAGFCLIANGAYIAFGSYDRIGDCGEMHYTGTPTSLMIAFGAIAISLGFYIWHRLGSLQQFLRNPALISRQLAWMTFVLLVLAVAVMNSLAT